VWECLLNRLYISSLAVKTHKTSAVGLIGFTTIVRTAAANKMHRTFNGFLRAWRWRLIDVTSPWRACTVNEHVIIVVVWDFYLYLSDMSTSVDQMFVCVCTSIVVNGKSAPLSATMSTTLFPLVYISDNHHAVQKSQHKRGWIRPRETFTTRDFPLGR